MGIVDVIGAVVLFDRVVQSEWGHVTFKWSSLDLLLFVVMVSITIMSLIYSLSERTSRPKWQNLDIWKSRLGLNKTWKEWVGINRMPKTRISRSS